MLNPGLSSYLGHQAQISFRFEKRPKPNLFGKYIPFVLNSKTGPLRIQRPNLAHFIFRPENYTLSIPRVAQIQPYEVRLRVAKPMSTPTKDQNLIKVFTLQLFI